nr:GNAT family N-acetyltransferase [uncultured Devosia sp.]
MNTTLRMRKDLSAPQPSPVWPAGAGLAPVAQTRPDALHAILADAYVNGFGTVPTSCAEWWTSLTSDSEFDPALVFVATDASGAPIGLAQCWTSGFVKDLAVVPQWRGKGIGDALLAEVFAVFRDRGLSYVDLKVGAANAPAIALYRRAGMVEAPL